MPNGLVIGLIVVLLVLIVGIGFFLLRKPTKPTVGHPRSDHASPGLLVGSGDAHLSPVVVEPPTREPEMAVPFDQEEPASHEAASSDGEPAGAQSEPTEAEAAVEPTDSETVADQGYGEERVETADPIGVDRADDAPFDGQSSDDVAKPLDTERDPFAEPAAVEPEVLPGASLSTPGDAEDDTPDDAAPGEPVQSTLPDVEPEPAPEPAPPAEPVVPEPTPEPFPPADPAPPVDPAPEPAPIADPAGDDTTAAEPVFADGGFGPASAQPAEDGSGPQGWQVKGSQGSMLFHTVDSPSFEHTRADVWFESEDAAREAGFAHWDRKRR